MRAGGEFGNLEIIFDRIIYTKRATLYFTDTHMAIVILLPNPVLTSRLRIGAAIRADILNGTLAAGQRLKAADLAARYGVSQIPVREALLQLEGEGLVLTSAHKGATIRNIDARFVSNIYEIRSVLESMLLMRAATSIRAEVLIALKATQDTYEAVAARNDTMKMLAANREFHRRIDIAGDNEDAVQLLDRGWELLQALRLKFGYSKTRWQTIARDHRQMIEALEAHDSIGAGDLSKRHCAAARDDLLQRMSDV